MPYRDPAAHREYQRQWRANRRAEFFADKRCEKCGGTEELQLHHRDRTTKTSHKIWSWSDERRLAEISKCDVLCRTCHVGMHRRHGTVERYRSGCACSKCVNAAWIAKWRERRLAET